MANYSATLLLLPVEYRDGFVIAPMGRKPIETRSLIAPNASEIWAACERLYRDYDGTHDAKIAVFIGKKPRGFDAIVKSNLWKLECHRNPIWAAIS